MLLKSRGQVLLNSNVARISVNNHKSDGVILENGLNLNADIVVSNADPGWTYDKLLPAHKKRRWSRNKLKKSRWSMGLFVWYFGTRNTKKNGRTLGITQLLMGLVIVDY